MHEDRYWWRRQGEAQGPCRRPWVLVAAVAAAVSPRPAHADETAVVVVNAPSAHGASHLSLMNRDLPAGVSFKIQIPVPGADVINGSLVVWPARGDTACQGTPSKDAHQYHELGLVASGTGDGRVLEATVPPLQLATRYCLRLAFDQRLPPEILNGLAAAVGATPIDWRTTCSHAAREAQVAGKIDHELAGQLQRHGGTVSVSAARVTQAAITIAKLFHIEAHCDQIQGALDHRGTIVDQQQRAVDRLRATKRTVLCLPPSAADAPKQVCAPPATSLLAWPAVVAKSGTDYQVARLADVLDANTAGLAAALADAAPGLADELAIVAGIPDADQKAAASKLLKSKLAAKPGAAQPLAVFLTTPGHYVDLTGLYETDAAGLATPAAKQMFADLLSSLSASRAAVILQLQQMRTMDRKPADTWIERLTALADANKDAEDTLQLVEDAEKAVDAVVQGIPAALGLVVQTDTVKDLLRLTATEAVQRSSSNAPVTDEKGSWISPNIGVLAAAPFIERRGKHGIATGWLAPFAGASVYFDRVDRVVDLEELVGNTFWQRNSLTVGFLLSTPSLNGKDVTGPWSAGVVPVVGFGHRMTQYLRLDVGAIPFKDVDANPVITSPQWGVALWVGASIDADVWAVVSGKLGR
jgi:hypothetical protein